jgi:hypothetical protein
VGAWVGQVVGAVRSQDAPRLMARLDTNDSMAQSCVQNARISAAQLQVMVTDKFTSAQVPLADRWATVASEHLLALQLCHQGKYVVRRCIAACNRLLHLHVL